jgi:hypothetical protein
MKRVLIILYILSIITFNAKGQIGIPKKENQKIDENFLEGYVADLSFEKTKVEKDWTKYLKTIGKLETSQSVFLLKNALTLGFKENEVIYSKLIFKGDYTSIWIGLDPKNTENIEQKMKTLEQKLKDYIIRFEQSELQNQINEAERAAKFQGKNYQKTLKKESKLEKDLIKADERQKKLEKDLEETKLKKEDLKVQMEMNKTQKEKTYTDLEKINKVLEQHKTRLKDLAEKTQ